MRESKCRRQAALTSARSARPAGLVAGFLARAIVPGRDSMSLGATSLLGIADSFVGGFLADVLFRSASEDRGLAPSGIIGSIVGAIIVLLLYNAFAGRRVVAR